METRRMGLAWSKRGRSRVTSCLRKRSEWAGTGGELKAERRAVFGNGKDVGEVGGEGATEGGAVRGN